jgi:hypothetical protein
VLVNPLNLHRLSDLRPVQNSCRTRRNWVLSASSPLSVRDVLPRPIETTPLFVKVSAALSGDQPA